MTFRVFLSEKAQDDLDKLPAKIADQILADCRRLADDPENLYRLRAGDYRVVFKRSGTRIDIARVLSKSDFQRAY